MMRVNTHIFCILLYVTRIHLTYGNLIDNKVLNVGEELREEILPLQMGSRFYQLQGLKQNTWYEVKISYPASIPASFYLELSSGNSDLVLKHHRKLLNTEKLIFKNNDENVLGDQRGMYVLVTVEPAGVVAVPHGHERESVIFNIVCEELLLGIPHNAWWVVILVVLCLGLALVIPSFLPSFLLRSGRKARVS